MPIGWRWLAGPSRYERPRRRQLPRQFHAANASGTLFVRVSRPQPCAFCGQLNPKGLRTDICAICLDYYCRHGLMLPQWEITTAPGLGPRARIAKPMFQSNPNNRLIHSRLKPVPMGLCASAKFASWRSRQRSHFALSRGTLHYLAVRRITAARCLAMGMRRLRPGVWYSDLADVLYAQLAAPAGQEWDMGV
jgi:hypothetical protein